MEGGRESRRKVPQGVVVPPSSKASKQPPATLRRTPPTTSRSSIPSGGLRSGTPHFREQLAGLGPRRALCHGLQDCGGLLWRKRREVPEAVFLSSQPPTAGKTAPDPAPPGNGLRSCRISRNGQMELPSPPAMSQRSGPKHRSSVPPQDSGSTASRLLAQSAAAPGLRERLDLLESAAPGRPVILPPCRGSRTQSLRRPDRPTLDAAASHGPGLVHLSPHQSPGKPSCGTAHLGATPSSSRNMNGRDSKTCSRILRRRRSVSPPCGKSMNGATFPWCSAWPASTRMSPPRASLGPDHPAPHRTNH